MSARAIILIFILANLLPVYGQNARILSPEEINDLVPRKLEGFRQKNESISKQMTIGNLTYTLCERTFVRGSKSIQILLFDYVDANIMYAQALRKWGDMTPVDTDSAIFRNIEPHLSIRGWESYERSGPRAQFILGVNSRFYLTISGQGMDLPELRAVFNKFNFQKFPE